MNEHESPSVAATDRVAAVVYNPVKADLAALKAAATAEVAAGGWGPTLWFETSKEDEGQGPAKEALAAGAAMIIVAGGDGTVRAVAEAMYDSSASLALIPSGTGNLLARNLDLPLDDIKLAMHTAFAGRDRDIDIARVDIRRADKTTTKHAYVVMVGLGLDAKMIEKTNDDLKKKIGWLAYVNAIVAAMGDKEKLHLRYRLDGKEPQSVRAHTLIVGNCGSLPGGVMLLPDAAIDDGNFDIVALRPEGIIGWLQISFKVIWENGVLRRSKAASKLMALTKEVRALSYETGRELTIQLDKPHAVELDGDSFGEAIGLTTWIEPGALTVRVPAG